MSEIILETTGAKKFNPIKKAWEESLEFRGELIRCKDCRWWSGKKEYRDYPMCVDHMRMMNADDYCSRAEKRKIE